MSLDITTTQRQTRQPIEAKEQPKGLRVTGKLREAIELMVWQGTKRDDAAKAVGMVPKSLYNAFRKHHVKAFYLSELEVLRTSARARATHRMIELSEQDDHKAAAVTASRYLLGDEDQAHSSAAPRQAAGITIVIEAGARPPTIVGSVVDSDATDGNSPVISIPRGG